MTAPAPTDPPRGPARQDERWVVEGPVGRTLLGMAAPMAVGIAAIVAFGVVDTYFVGLLGDRELAAMGYVFPVVFAVMSLAIGLGIGATSVIARAIGAEDRERMRRVTTDALVLGVIVVVLVAAIGVLTLRPLFRAMGAPENLLGLIEQYMIPWYAGVGMLVVPMIGNAAIRATGDTKTPSVVMIFAGLLNAVLDPILIFGWGPFPRLELRGAAIATVMAWALTLVAALWMLGVRERMITLERPHVREVLRSWSDVLRIGVPAAATNVLVPLAGGVVTRIVSGFGSRAVAGYGVATRLESLCMVAILGLSTAATAFVAQNYGAGRWGRVREALVVGVKANLVWSTAVAAVMAIVAVPVARFFSTDPDVVDATATYLRVVPITYGLLGSSMLVNSVLNGTNQPAPSAIVIVVRLFVFVVPLAWVGSRWAGVTGAFVGVAAGNALTGITSVAWLSSSLVAREREAAPSRQ